MRHIAWLNAAPEKAENDKSKAPAKPRLQQMRDAAGDDEFEPDMPPLGAAGYLLDHLWSAGPTVGDGPLTNGELNRYQENMGILLSPWECLTLRRLSTDYLNEFYSATKADRPAPYADSTDAERLRRANIKRKFRAFLE